MSDHKRFPNEIVNERNFIHFNKNGYVDYTSTIDHNSTYKKAWIEVPGQKELDKVLFALEALKKLCDIVCFTEAGMDKVVIEANKHIEEITKWKSSFGGFEVGFKLSWNQTSKT
jgi:hypothetical protein